MATIQLTDQQRKVLHEVACTTAAPVLDTASKDKIKQLLDDYDMRKAVGEQGRPGQAGACWEGGGPALLPAAGPLSFLGGIEPVALAGPESSPHIQPRAKRPAKA